VHVQWWQAGTTNSKVATRGNEKKYRKQQSTVFFCRAWCCVSSQSIAKTTKLRKEMENADYNQLIVCYDDSKARRNFEISCRVEAATKDVFKFSGSLPFSLAFLSF